MTARPTYVTAIGWLLVVFGGLSIASVALVAAAPSLLPGPPAGASAIFLNLLSSLAELVCGYFVLKGANWARWAYLVLCILTGAYLLLDRRTDASLVVLWGVVAVLTLAGLFTPAANRFFGSKETERAPDEIPID